MTWKARNTRILAFPFDEAFQSARLEALAEVRNGGRRDFYIDFQELAMSAPPELVALNGKPGEHVQGTYLPRRLCCRDVHWLEITGLYTRLDEVPLDHGARSLRGTLYWRSPGEAAKWGWFNGTKEPGDFMISARQYTLEERPGKNEAVDFMRDWSTAPELPSRLVRVSRKIRQRFGGDPVTFRLGKRVYHRRLFVGGLDCQTYQRPEVGAVLNLGDEPSKWSGTEIGISGDRWVRKGEGQSGMDMDEITAEARWVIERLKVGQRVLVHCSAGFNRSVTVCCAVLILLEGLTAEQALERVREQHPWARPDPHHWLVLRWIAKQSASF